MSDREPRVPGSTGSTGSTGPGGPEDDAALERYLWDPAAPAVEEVARLERALAPLRHRERVPELRERRPLVRAASWLAAAVVLVALGVGGAAAWLWSWPEGRAWPVLHGAADSLPVGEDVRVEPGESLVVRVARIGWMRVEGGAELALVTTTSNRHRLALQEGTIRAGLWAPPGSFGVQTPAGWVVDLGCLFRLEADSRETRVEVTSGWVQLENAWGESLVPAGAWSAMTADRIPSAPLYKDAPPRFQAAAAELERGNGDEAAVDTLLATARERDALTLLVLATRHADAREPLLRRAAELAPPPTDELYDRALNGDANATWDWIQDLPLPPPKRWLPNWRDGWRG